MESWMSNVAWAFSHVSVLYYFSYSAHRVKFMLPGSLNINAANNDTKNELPPLTRHSFRSPNPLEFCRQDIIKMNFTLHCKKQLNLRIFWILSFTCFFLLVKLSISLTSAAFFSESSSLSWASFKASEYLSSSSSVCFSFFCRLISSSSNWKTHKTTVWTIINIFCKK